MFKSVFCFILLFILCHPLIGQLYNIRTYNVDNGLPQDYVYHLVQDKRNHLLISTGEGFSDFDGFDFRSSTIKNGLAENFVTVSCMDAFGKIWLGHFQHGISVGKNGFYKSITGSGIENAHIHSLQVDSAGFVWAAAGNDGLYRIDSAGNVKHPKWADGLQATSVLIDPNSNFIVTSPEKILVLSYDPDRDVLTLVQELELPEQVSPQTLLWDKKRNGFWTIADVNKVVFIQRKGKTYSISESILLHRSDGVLKSIALDAQDNLWCGGIGLGVLKIAFQEVSTQTYSIQRISSQNGLPSNDVQSIFCDSENNVWVGFYGFGLVQIAGESFLWYPKIAAEEKIYATAVNNRGQIGIGTATGFCFYADGNPAAVPEMYGAKNGFLNEPVTAVSATADGKFWIGTENGAIRTFDPLTHTFQNINAQYNISQKSVNRIIETPEKNIFIATLDGVWFLHDGKADLLTTQQGLLHNNIQSIAISPDGTFWFAAHGSVPFSMKGNEITAYQAIPGLQTFNFNACLVDRKGNVWYGSEGDGLFMFDGKNWKRYTVSEGLASNYCYGLLLDYTGRIWATHKNGVSVLRSDDLFQSFGTRNGFMSPENMMNACCSIDNSAQLIFGTQQGIVLYNRRLDYQSMAVPLLSFTSLHINDELRDWSALPEQLAYGAYAIRIGFSAVNLRDPNAVKYRYRLAGMESKWNELTETGEVFYPKLLDGIYVFEVITSKDGKIWSKEPLQIRFTIAAPFWKKIWFYALMAVLLIASVLIFIRYRTRALINAKLNLERIVDLKTAELKEEKRIVEEGKAVIEEQNKEITSSLNYARGIQNSLLPAYEDLQGKYKNFFVFYRPRDIVSGDFYWMAEQDEFIYFAVADCTGHGVPGAFMSFIGSTLLTKLIVDQKNRDLSAVMDELNKNFASVLHRDRAGHLYDGMEIILCAIDRKQMTVSFAGAGRPFWLVRDGELLEFKGTAFPIDGNDINTRIYKQDSISIQKSDMVYLFSDGYIDQFGEEINRRFGSRRFRELVKSTAYKSADDQFQTIQTNFDAWRGNEKQIDDVLVVGVKF
ncbi:MAG: two-component regulator propeller domain-containing protein [Bacteroidia bacterium]